MFIACRGIPVLVGFLEADYAKFRFVGLSVWNHRFLLLNFWVELVIAQTMAQILRSNLINSFFPLKIEKFSFKKLKNYKNLDKVSAFENGQS